MVVALVFVRLFFGAPLPDSQRGTLFLLISTAAISTAAIIFQDPQAVDDFIGPYSSLGEFFHWMTSFLAFICYFLLLNAYFCRSPFNMTYWAISFPSSALGLVWLFYWQIGNCDRLGSPTPGSGQEYSSEERCTNNQDSDAVRAIAILTTVNAAVSNTILGVNTVLALLQKRLFLPMPQWSPAAFLQLHHFAFRTALYKISTSLTKLQALASNQPLTPPPFVPPHRFFHSFEQRPLTGMGSPCPCAPCVAQVPPTQQQVVEGCIESLILLDLSFSNYVHLKRENLWPTLRVWLPQVQFPHMEEADAVGDIQGKLHHMIGALASLDSGRLTPAEVLGVLTECQQWMNAVARKLHGHLDGEEVMLSPLVAHFTDLPTANRLMREMWGCMEVSVKRVVIPWIINILPDHMQRMALIDCLAWSTDDALTILGRWLDGAIDPFLYAQLCVDYPMLKMKNASPYAKFW